MGPGARDALVPALPATPDPDAELRSLDAAIARATDPAAAITLRLERAAITDRVDDLQAALARSAAWLAEAPASAAAWQVRTRALAAAHRFAEARAALAQVRAHDRDPSVADELAALLDEATGQHARAAAYRQRRAREHATPAHLVAWATNLALADRVDDALAVMPAAVAAIRHNPARLVGWLLFQWGRLHAARGAHAAARRFYEASYARFPGAVATVVHLAETVRATGGDPAALVARARVRDPDHPALLALAGRVDEARAAWERYVAAAPAAYADHAARFYLAAGRDPVRALALARVNHAARDTLAARALVVEAALAAGEAGPACEVAAPLAEGSRGDRFLAWRAWSACGEPARAEALGRALGVR